MSIPRRSFTGALIVLVGMLALPVAASAQDLAQEHLRRMQQHADQMTRTMHRMEAVREQAREIERTVVRELERLHHHGAPDALRLQEHERLRDMAHAMGHAVDGMHQAMQRMRDLARDRQMEHSPELQRDMDRLRQHMDGMCDQMEEGLRVMDRLRERLRTP